MSEMTFDPKLIKILATSAASHATTTGWPCLTAGSLMLYALEYDDSIRAIVSELTLEPDTIAAEITIPVLEEMASLSTGSFFVDHSFTVMHDAIIAVAMSAGKKEVEPIDILTVFAESDIILLHAGSFDIDAKIVEYKKKMEKAAKAAKMASAAKKKSTVPGGKFPGAGGPEPDGEMTEEEAAIAFLTQYGENLTEKALMGKIEPVIGRDNEIESILLALGKKKTRNALLVGPAGAGKTAIAEGIACKIAEKTINPMFADSLVITMDIGQMMAGTKFRGEFEERVVEYFKQAKVLGDNLIIFIDEVHQLSSANGSGDGSNSFANMLKPYMARDGVRIIAATTTDEAAKHMKDPALRRRFTTVTIDEPDTAMTNKIVCLAKTGYEEYHGVTIPDDVVAAVVTITNKHNVNLAQPDKAFSALDKICTAVKFDRRVDVTIADVEAVLSKEYGLPVSAADRAEKIALKGLKTALNGALFGQESAVDALTESVIIARMGLREHNKPAGAFMFTGPTGVGKTYAAKTLAKSLGRKMIRLDMSEYAEPHSVSRLWGSPPGYLGYGEDGELVKKVKEAPYSVLLLDEWEKAHNSIQNAFLQVLSEGIMTTPRHEKVDFRNVIIIFTSNVGGTIATKKRIGFGDTDSKTVSAETSAEYEKFWTPEFRNRFDGIVQFVALSDAAVREIVRQELNTVVTLAIEQGVLVTIDDSVTEYVAVNGYDKRMGARPLARYIDKHVKSLIAYAIMDDKTEATITIKDNKIVIE